MTESLDAIKQSISDKLRELFDIRRQRARMKNEYAIEENKLKDKLAIEDMPLAKRHAELLDELYHTATNNKAGLLVGKLKSFAMAYGKISFKLKPLSFKIVDKANVEKLARRDGILNKVGTFERVWKPDAKALEAWLVNNPSKAAKYEQYVTRDGGYDEVYAHPNGAYLTEFDPDHLTEKGVKIEPLTPEQDTQDD